MDQEVSAPARSASELYDAQYYASHLGPEPYGRNEHWLDFFGRIASELVRSLGPKRVLDAGCALGLLVESLWDRGVEAHGRDISTYAIANVRADVRPYCEVGSIAEPFAGTYDLVTCIEVLEHLSEAEAVRAISSITSVTARILFSSSPIDFDEPTHINVKPSIYWLRKFAAQGFAPVAEYDASFVCPHAMLLERVEGSIEESRLTAFAEIIRLRLEVSARDGRIVALDSRAWQTEKDLKDELWRKEQAAQKAEQAAEVRALQAALARESAERRADLAEQTQAATAEQAQSLAVRLVEAEQARDALLSSTSWRVSAPLRIAKNLARAALGRRGRTLARRVVQVAQRARDTAAPAVDTSSDVRGILRRRYPALEPLRISYLPQAPKSLNIVTDSINAGSLYGGVATAMIFAALLAKRLGTELRLITRTEPPDTGNFAHILQLHGISWNGNIAFLHAPPQQPEHDIPCSPDDLFLTTSWWTTWPTRRAVAPGRIVYLLQEDERMFYPRGDDWVRSAETLADPDIHYVINSELLFEHLTHGAQALPNIGRRGICFEPAFPTFCGEPRPAATPAGKRKFLFYARPQNLRNLYYRGIEAIAAAIEQGVLDPQAWDFNFVGREIGPVSLPGGVRPRLLENLKWEDYAALVRRTDLALALMHTPHPSYPPLDLAAAGAVVVTNAHGRKTNLDRYSPNILCVEPSVEGLAAGLAQAVALARDTAARQANMARNRLNSDWATALEPALSAIADRLGP